MKKNIVYIAAAFIVTAFVFSCGPEKPDPQQENKGKEKPVAETPVKTVATPVFNPDSAYAFVKAQVDFGPRVPGTPAHAKCADYLVKKLKGYGFTVTVQNGTVRTYDKKQFNLKNVIAVFNPSAQSRILLCSHWDTRPITESDTKDQDKPGDGANDGASGVGVAMEIARNIQAANPAIGVDIIYFDLEDYGTSGDDESWCLGSTFWSKHLHTPNYSANFGVLMDMVGAPNAVFPKESISMSYAPDAVNKVWNTAGYLGYGNYFISQERQFIGSDDHVPVNKAGIKCIDIIEYNQVTGGFADYHHTHKDNMDMIDRNTLKAVGQTLLEVIYSEK